MVAQQIMIVVTELLNVNAFSGFQQSSCRLQSLVNQKHNWFLYQTYINSFRPKKLIICLSDTFLENDAGGRLFIFYFIV